MTASVIEQKATRSYGIDLLKLFSMLMIVLLHVLGIGGVLAGLQPGTAAHDLGWWLESACYGAVNCFALTTGFLMAEGRYKPHRLLTLWLQVVFYTIGITVFFRLFYPDVVTMLNWKAAPRPVMARQYWYFTAYFAMYLFIPFFNKLIAVLTKGEFRRLLGSILLLMVLAFWAKDDIFRLQNGYTMAWLSMLYFFGAYFKKYPPEKVRPMLWIGIYLLATGCTWACKLATVYLDGQAGGPAAWGGMMLSYTSPTVFLASLMLFLLFLHLQVRPRWLQKLAAWLSPAAFSVYIIHCHPLVWHNVLTGRFASFASYGLPGMPAAVFLAAGSIWLACLLADRVRILLFGFVGIDRISQKLVDGLVRLGGRLMRENHGQN